MLSIPVGTELTFYKDENIIVTVIDKNNTVRIDDLELSISAAARYIHEKLEIANSSGAYQGGGCFKYNNELLTDRRRRLEL